MLINENWKIESTELNVTLYQKKIKGKNGKEYWKVEGYFSTAKNALKYMVELQLKGTGYKDLETIVNKIDELEVLINQLEVN